MPDPAVAGEPDLDEHLADLSSQIFAAWRELRRGAAVRSLREVLYGSGTDALDPGQLDALEMLVDHGTWRMSDLATALYIDASTATRAVDRLVERELAVRRPATDDARGIVVSASAQGRKQCLRIRQGRQVLMRGFLEEFTPDECEQLASLMGRLVQSVNRSAAG